MSKVLPFLLHWILCNLTFIYHFKLEMFSLSFNIVNRITFYELILTNVRFRILTKQTKPAQSHWNVCPGDKNRRTRGHPGDQGMRGREGKGGTCAASSTHGQLKVSNIVPCTRQGVATLLGQPCSFCRIVLVSQCDDVRQIMHTPVAVQPPGLSAGFGVNKRASFKFAI